MFAGTGQALCRRLHTALHRTRFFSCKAAIVKQQCREAAHASRGEGVHGITVYGEEGGVGGRL